MDRPLLHTLVDRLRADERLPAFVASLPARARVSEPALPLLVAALHEELRRPLCVLLPDDADARDLAEAAAWFLGEERVALFPSRGVRFEQHHLPRHQQPQVPEPVKETVRGRE